MSRKSSTYYETHVDLAKTVNKPVPFKRAQTGSVRSERRAYVARSLPANYVPIESTRVTPREIGRPEVQSEPQPQEFQEPYWNK